MSNTSRDHHLQPHRTRSNGARSAPLMSPALLAALNELAKTEELPVTALIAVLINEALDHRLHRGGA